MNIRRVKKKIPGEQETNCTKTLNNSKKISKYKMRLQRLAKNKEPQEPKSVSWSGTATLAAESKRLYCSMNNYQPKFD